MGVALDPNWLKETRKFRVIHSSHSDEINLDEPENPYNPKPKVTGKVFEFKDFWSEPNPSKHLASGTLVSGSKALVTKESAVDTPHIGAANISHVDLLEEFYYGNEEGKIARFRFNTPLTREYSKREKLDISGGKPLMLTNFSVSDDEVKKLQELQSRLEKTEWSYVTKAKKSDKNMPTRIKDLISTLKDIDKDNAVEKLCFMSNYFTSSKKWALFGDKDINNIYSICKNPTNVSEFLKKMNDRLDSLDQTISNKKKQEKGGKVPNISHWE